MSLIQIDFDLGGRDAPGFKQIATMLHDLINGIVEPKTAAKTIDEIVVSDFNEAYLSYTSVPKPTAEQIASGRIQAPQPGKWLGFLWDSFGKAATVIPYDYAGQDRLVNLIQELQSLPPRKLLRFVGGKLIDYELYNLTEKNEYDGFQDTLWHLHQANFMFVHAETTTPYLNFSAFLARMYAVGIKAGVPISALTHRHQSPFCMQRIAWTAKSADSLSQAARYQPYAAAAALWLIYAGDALFEYCDNGVHPFGVGWRRPLWESWKEKFGEVVEDARFNELTRHLARQAIERMDQLEQRGWKAEEVEYDEDDEEEEEEEEE